METSEFKQKYSMRSPAVKRLMREAMELREPTEEFSAHPLDDNLFEWHFTVRGPADSEFDNGYYHGRIILPPDYPMKPPSIILLTPNGRFEINKRICLSISDHHPERWQPSWSIRTTLLAIIGFMPTPGNGALGSLDFTVEERKLLAKRSQEWVCNVCGCIKDLLQPRTSTGLKVKEEASQIAQNMNIKGDEEKSNSVNQNQNSERIPDNQNIIDTAGSSRYLHNYQRVPNVPCNPANSNFSHYHFVIKDLIYYFILAILSSFLAILVTRRLWY